MQKVYSRINWEDFPSTNTSIDEDNLNKMDYAINEIDNRVVNLAGYEERAKESEENASLSETNAQASEAVANENAILSQSYSVGGTGTRENEEVDNAKYYYEQAERVAEGLGGALLPGGTITFEELDTVTSDIGYMYNISNDFTTDDRFIHSGVSYGSGTNVYLTADGLWDVLAGSNVVSVNGKKGIVSIRDTDIPSIYHKLSSDEIPPTGATTTVGSELVRFAQKILSIFDLITSIISRITALETDNINGGTLVSAYVTLEDGSTTVTDKGHDWENYKGFVLGVECTGGDGNQYSETRYIPKSYVNLSSKYGIKHMVGIYFSSSYIFTGLATFDWDNQSVTFVTSGFSGWTNPRWFVYGVK